MHFTAGGRLPSLPAAVACLEALADVLAALHAPSLEALHVELAADDAATAHAASSERRLHSSLAQLVLALEQGLLRRVPSLR